MQRARLLQQRLAALGLGRLELVAVLEEAPGAVAVDDGQLGAAQAGIDRLGDDVGQHRAALRRVAQVADADVEVGAGAGAGQQAEGGEQAGQQWAHGSLRWGCCQLRKVEGAGKYAESTAALVPRY
ncbi:hypothetical protein D3C86_1823940 [compost metagenome]